jgi:quercetin dioxygenase-like cupin family protein
MKNAIVTKPVDNKVDVTPWGSLTWYVSAAQGNSEVLTVGCCRIKPGRANPRHHHPNCEEVLYVLQGNIMHTLGDGEVEMQEGDTISVPSSMVHNARNIGDTEAVLQICFSSAERKTVGE